jgi:hypothetical protein
MTTPGAYLRKSKDTATKADHLGILMASAKAHGHNGDTVVYDDWARSGDIDKLGKRTEWKRLCDAIERGDHNIVFMNSLDRGGRSIEEWLRFVRLARSRNVRVIADGVDYSASENRDRLIFEAWAAEKELERAKERSARTVAIRRGRGDVTTGGHAAPYGQMWARAGDVGMDGDPRRIVAIDNPDEPMEPLLDAIKATKGNVLQAARRLNDLGVPTRSGRPWDPRVLTRALDRVGAIRARRGASVKGRRRAASDAPLSRLVQCHCGATMTPERDRRNGLWLGLVCAPGRKLGLAAHGRTVARSRHVMDRLKADIHYSRITIEKAGRSDPSKDRGRLDATKRKLGIALADDAISEHEYRRRMDAVKRDIAKLDDEVTVESEWTGFSPRTPLVDWTADDATIGDQLRRVVRVVRLDKDMMPAEVELRIRVARA